MCYSKPLICGDVEKAFNETEESVEGYFTTQINHQAPLEPEASVAYLEGEGEEAQLVIIGRSIDIHYHLHMLQEALGWENMRYEEAQAGAIRNQDRITSEDLAGAAALKFRRPVRYIPSLRESIEMTPKRHPYHMQIMIAADMEGNLSALETDMFVDNGAYFSIGDDCVRRSLMMLTSAYHIPNIKANCRLIYTNNPWGLRRPGCRTATIQLCC